MKLSDAHCHLQSDALFADLDAVLARAATAGVEQLACCATSPSDWERVLEVSSRFPQVIPLLGIHPWRVSNDWPRHLQTLESLLHAVPQAGIGETGLDFSTLFSNRAAQVDCFSAHLELARRLERPLIAHCVHAWGELEKVLRARPAPRILLHAYSGAPELIPALAKLGGFFSFNAAVALPRFRRMRAAAIAVPDDLLLAETDAPDFPPPQTPAPNEPACLSVVVQTLADLRGMAPDALVELLQSNFRRFFESV
jgi:TatD DNase family protein